VQATVPAHAALSPSTHFWKWAQQPAAAQPHVPGSKNTEWQSLRASQSASVVTLEHGATHLIAGHCGCGSFGSEHFTNDFAWQPGQ